MFATFSRLCALFSQWQFRNPWQWQVTEHISKLNAVLMRKLKGEVMKRLLRYMSVAAFLGMGSFLAQAAENLQAEAQQTINRFVQEDPGIKKLMDKSSGYAVYPEVVKGGLIIGGQHGKGIVYEQGRAVGETSVSGGSIGATAGGVAFREIICFQNPGSLQDFKSGAFDVNAQASAVETTRGADIRSKSGKGATVLVMPKSGIMGDASIGAQKYTFKPFTTQS